MTLSSELSPISETQAARVAGLLSRIAVENQSPELFEASLAVAFKRKGEVMLSDVDSKNPYRERNGDEGFILTLSVRVDEGDPSFEFLKPLIEETVQELAVAEQAELEAERAAIEARRAAVVAELAELDAKLASK